MTAPGDNDDTEDGFADESFNTSEYRALRALFRDECHEALELATRHLLHAEPDHIAAESLNELLRTTHSLKGTAGTVGLRDFTDAAHRLEGVFERLRAGALPWSYAMRDALVEVVDWLRALTDAGEDGAEGALLSEMLDRRLADLSGPAIPSSGDRVGAVPENPGGAQRPPSNPGDSGVARSGRAGEPAQLRVDPSRIDRLMDSVGELVFDRTRIERRVTELRGAVDKLNILGDAMRASAGPEPQGVRPLFAELTEQLGQLERLAGALLDDTAALRRTGNALQDGLTDIRMQSTRSLFSRLAPQVRALARAAGKPIHLITLGGETEFDKSVADQMVEPLIHLLRNAVAHGIEPPETRRVLGKPDEGQLTLSARHEGASVVIELSDDGAGVDPAAVRRRLLESGRWSATRAKRAGDDEVLRALFEAQVSSRDEVDELAGRGIGLDAVKGTIVRLGGDISVATALGRGTTFTIRVPLTTAISAALLFKVGGHVFAIPNVHVLETSKVEVSPAIPSHLTVREEAVPLVLLHRHLGAPIPPDARAVPAVVIDYASRRLAVTCDKIVGPREIVVKNLGPLLGALPLYAGGTISGSGKVQLILDPAALVRLAYPRETAPEAVPGRPAGRVLVADDSRAVREAVGMLLGRAGYQVDLADDGMAAWRLLGRAHYDALVTDLEMPQMGGFELIERVRADPVLGRLPVVIISSRADQAARARAAALGVRHVLGKPVDQTALVDSLRAP